MRARRALALVAVALCAAASLHVLAPAAAGSALAASPVRAPAADSTATKLDATARAAARYLESRRLPDGGFAEPGRDAEPGLTAWAALALAAAGVAPPDAAAYLAGRPYPTANDLALRVLAFEALGRPTGVLARQLAGLRRPDGRIGPAVNSTIWGILALRAAGRSVDPSTVRWLTASQSADGGFAWQRGLAPDADDTAAAVQALHAAGVSCTASSVRRALAFVRRHQNSDGGFESEDGLGSNAQTTAWAIQALLACGQAPGSAAFGYLRGLQAQDGSVRYSARHATTPVWVTATALPALARRPFPL